MERMTTYLIKTKTAIFIISAGDIEMAKGLLDNFSEGLSDAITDWHDCSNTYDILAMMLR